MTFFDIFDSQQLIAAHRGFRAFYPENTLAAFNASIGRCHFIELDVQLSRDLIPVVFHDIELDRTSNVKEVRTQLGLQSTQLRDWDLAQLKALDIGSWFFDSDPFGTLKDQSYPKGSHASSQPQSLLTLEEVLLAPSLAHIPINVEIKDHRGWQHDLKVTENVLEVIKRSRTEDRVLLSSFNHDYLIIANQCAPEITTAALQDISHPQNLIEYLRSLGVAAYHPSNAITSPDLVRRLRAAGLGVNVYTVNDPKRQQDLFNYGVTAIFTDFPDLHPL